MIVTLPVFCLFWCSVYYRKNDKWRSIWKVFRQGCFYTAIVLACVLLYAFVYSISTEIAFSKETLLGTMGFIAPHGPEHTGYSMEADLKWVISYILYALLGAITIVVAIIIYAKQELVKKIRRYL